MKKPSIIIGICLAFLLGVFGISAAQAGTGYSSCKLSANWSVNVSGNWLGTTLEHVTLDSPGSLDAAHSSYTAYYTSGGYTTYEAFELTGIVGGRYEYETFQGGIGGVKKIGVNPASTPAHTCYAYQGVAFINAS